MTTPETSADTSRFDEAKAEAFAERFVAALNTSSLMMMFSIGYRTGSVRRDGWHGLVDVGTNRRSR